MYVLKEASELQRDHKHCPQCAERYSVYVPNVQRPDLNLAILAETVSVLRLHPANKCINRFRVRIYILREGILQTYTWRQINDYRVHFAQICVYIVVNFLVNL